MYYCNIVCCSIFMIWWIFMCLIMLKPATIISKHPLHIVTCHLQGFHHRWTFGHSYWYKEGQPKDIRQHQPHPHRLYVSENNVEIGCDHLELILKKKTFSLLTANYRCSLFENLILINVKWDKDLKTCLFFTYT